MRALAFFGGATQIIVPNNLKQGVKSSCWYDPDLNQIYLEIAHHYSAVVIPSRVCKPRDKAKVEVAVQVVERWILARLRNRTYFSPAALNQAIRQLRDDLNHRKMEHMENSRRELFEALDRPALRSLLERPYEFATWKVVRVNIDYHVILEKDFYSVPHALIHQEVRIYDTERMKEIFHKNQREPVVIHPHNPTPGRYSTQTDHVPTKHQKTGEWNAERLVLWAAEIGPHTAQLIQAILSSRQHPEQAFRSCLGILRLSGQYAHTHMESAYPLAQEAKIRDHREVKTFLETLPPLPNPKAAPMPSHANIRGNHYYQ